MTTVHLDDEVAAALTMQAAAHGLSLEAYLTKLTTRPPGIAPYAPLSGEDLVKALRDEATSDVVVPGTFTRADIYREHA